MTNSEAIAGSISVDERRQYDRVPGPFDGQRVGGLEVPVRIYDLSEGGCFVNAMHEQQPGIEVVLKIELPREGWITVKAETLYRKPDFGFAVRFVGMTDQTTERLQRAVRWAKERGPSDV